MHRAQLVSINEVIKLHQAGKLDAAERGYDKILAKLPQHPDALHMKGVIALQRGDALSAVKLISRVVAIRPDDASVYSNLAAALLRLGLFERARDYALRSLTLNARGLAAENVLGAACAKLGEHDYAVAAFERALRIDPGHKASMEGLLDNLRSLGRWDEILRVISSVKGIHDDGLEIRKAQALRSLGRFDEALACMKRCRFTNTFDWQVNMLKLRLEREEPELATEHGQRLLEIKNESSLKGFESAECALSERWLDPVPAFVPNDADHPERNVICFTLWGNDPKYTYNAVLNARLVPKIYPGWRARFYVDASVPPEIIEALLKYDARVIHVEADERTHLKLFWRFLATDDPQVERFLCRDCDSLVNPREKAAVDEWLASGKRFHVMRDHPEHAELIMAGMWGGVAGLLPKLSEQAVTYYEKHQQKWRWVDQDFLRDRIWPLIVDDCLVHDAYYQMGEDIRPFPAGSELAPGEHVGGYRPRFAAEIRASEVAAAAQAAELPETILIHRAA
jgi:tetratricopeptide (TPR) repeat protein